MNRTPEEVISHHADISKWAARNVLGALGKAGYSVVRLESTGQDSDGNRFDRLGEPIDYDGPLYRIVGED